VRRSAVVAFFFPFGRRLVIGLGSELLAQVMQEDDVCWAAPSPWACASSFFSCRPELFGRIVGQLPRSSWLSVLCVSRSWYALLVTRGVLPLAGEAGVGLLFAAVRTGNVGLLKTCIAHPHINKVRCQQATFFLVLAFF
jgi:hypothetical protein